MEGKSRRQALKKLGTGASLFAINPLNIKANDMEKRKLKSNINHSVCRWCYSKIGLEDLCVAAKKIGLKSIELVGPGEWNILKKHGLHCAMPNGGEIGSGPAHGFEQQRRQLRAGGPDH